MGTVKKQLGLIFIVIALILVSHGFAIASQSFKIMTYNISWAKDPVTRKTVYPKIYETIKEVGPDILAMQEFMGNRIRFLNATGFRYFYSINSYARKKWTGDGLAILSRWPIKGEQVELGAPSSRSIIKSEIVIDGKKISLYSVHLDRYSLRGKGVLASYFAELDGASPHYDVTKNLMQIIQNDKSKYKIVVGDFNTFPFSASYNLIKKYLIDSFDSEASFSGTYRFELNRDPKLRSLPNPRIDYIFHTKNIEVIKAYVMEKGPSDHYPVVAEVRIRD